MVDGNCCWGASRQRYAGGRADSVMPGGGPTALCPDSVMLRQRYALPCLGGCLPKIATCPRNRKIDWFYNSLIFDQNTRENWKWGTPLQKSRIDCNLHIKTTFLAKTWNYPMTHSFDLPWTLYQKRTRKMFFVEQRMFSLFYAKIAT